MADKKLEEKIYDIRTLEYSFHNGLISKKEYESYLQSLPDDEGNYEFVEMTEETEQAEDDSTNVEITQETTQKITDETAEETSESDLSFEDTPIE